MAQGDKNQSGTPQEMALDIESREQISALQFVQTDENPGDLTVILPDDTPDNLDDNARIVLPDYIALAGAGLPPALTLADGTVIPGEEILDLIEGLDYGKAAPAAGRQGGQNSDGGGAGFTAYTTEGLGDDLNHGPYDGAYIGPRVEFGDQGPLFPDDEDGSGGGGGGGTPSRFTGSGSAIFLNNDSDVLWRMHTDPDPAAPSSQIARNFFANLHTIGGLGTENGADNSGVEHLGGGYGQVAFWSNLGSPAGDDWDGGRIWLQAGETLTLTNQTPGGHYWLAISDDHDAAAVTPPGQPQGVLEWDQVLETNTVGESLSYTATADGWYYFGAGSELGTTPNNPGAVFAGTYDYQTLITISPPGATSNVIPGTSGGDTLVGTAGDDIITSGDGADTLTGAGGNDVLVGGAGDDILTGGSGADTFMFNGSASTGDDTIMDFTVGEGDVINLDALFDSLGVASVDRAVDAQIVGGDTVLRVGTEAGGVFTDATAGTFSVTVNGSALSDTDVDNLIASGNLVVDES